MPLHKIDLTGDYRQTIYSTSRRLLVAGAGPGGTVEIWRDGQLSMTGTVGKCAKLTVRESDHGNPSMQIINWKPFPATLVGAN